MKRILSILFLGVMALAATDPQQSFDSSQDKESAQDREARIARRVNEALAKELESLRGSVTDLVKSELAGKPVPSLPGNKKVDDALALITEDLLKKHATYLASDELEGRNSGFPGNDKAAAYIADVMKKAGLAPAGEEKDVATYYQPFKVDGRTTRNVIGFLEGTDTDLKKEIIVLGAHYDHVGTEDQGNTHRFPSRGEDQIWNGADDNGSGTTTVLGVIKAFGEGGLRCRRSLLFILFSGEEEGLLGSLWYVNHPTFPIRQHVFMLNLDMVGRNPDKPISIDGVGSSDGKKVRAIVEDAVRKTGLNAEINDVVKLQGGDSDHSSFRDKGIPFTFFFSGFHPDYHKATDHSEKLAYPNMVKIGKASSHILLGLANSEESLKYKRLDFADPVVPQPSRTLGIFPAAIITGDEMKALDLAKEDGAIKIDKVTPDSAADKAGMRSGDYLIQVAGVKLGRRAALDDLKAALGKVKANVEVELIVVRDGNRTTLKATWDK